MSGEIQVITQSVVDVTVTSTVNSFGNNGRFQKSLTILEMKNKLELITGASSASMKLSLFNKNNALVCELDNNDALLGSYPVDDGMRIHVEDASHALGEFEDISKVEKYEMQEDDYAKRTDSVRAFKERNKMGRFNPEEEARRTEEKAKREEEEKKKMESMKVGDRCEVRVPGQAHKRGAVKYLGETSFKPGLWVGVQYDEPHGKNDGSVDGKRYFECPAKYGGFVKPLSVEVGDFPEEGLSDDEM